MEPDSGGINWQFQIMNIQSLRGLDIVVRAEFSEAALWREHLAHPMGPARQQIFSRYTPLAKRIARDMYRNRPINNFDIMDIEQLAMEGLLQSIDRYDPLRNVPFGAFARPRIKGNVSNGLAKVSEASAFYSYRYRTEKERLASLMSANEGGSQSPLEALSKLAAGLAIGLMLEGNATDAISEVATPEPSAYDSLVWQEMSKQLRTKVGQLPPNEAFVIQHHYGNALSFQQVALLLNLSKGRVSQLHSSALARLRAQLSKYK